MKVEFPNSPGKETDRGTLAQEPIPLVIGHRLLLLDVVALELQGALIAYFVDQRIEALIEVVKPVVDAVEALLDLYGDPTVGEIRPRLSIPDGRQATPRGAPRETRHIRRRILRRAWDGDSTLGRISTDELCYEEYVEPRKGDRLKYDVEVRNDAIRPMPRPDSGAVENEQ